MSIYLLIAAVATSPTPENVTLFMLVPATTIGAQAERPAKPINNPGTWTTTADYPSTALINQREGVTRFSVMIGPDGRVTSCQVLASSGHVDLDAATCLNVTKRARFDPARDASGKPVVGKYSNQIRWQIPNFGSFASPSLPMYSYPRAPQVSDNTALLRIGKDDYPQKSLAAGHQGVSIFDLDVDKAGVVQACSIATSSGFPELDQQSCNLAKRWSFQPALGLDGEATAGRSRHNIRWKLPNTPNAPALATTPTLTINPYERQGTVTVIQDFDEQGQRIGCVSESANGLQPSDFACKNSVFFKIKPFMDTNGRPVSRRVISTLSIEHADVPEEGAEPQVEKKSD